MQDILYKCRCGNAVSVPTKIDMHCSNCCSVMLPSDEYDKVYPPEKIVRTDHPWEEVVAQGNKIAESLIRDGYSDQDMICIAGQLLHDGIFATVHSAAAWMREDSDRKVDLRVTVDREIVHIEKK